MPVVVVVGLTDLAAFVEAALPRAEALDVGADSWRRWPERVAAMVLARLMGFLLAAVVVVLAVEVEVTEPADGGRGGRRTVAEFRAVADDFARICVVVRCDAVRAGEGDVVVFGGVTLEGEGREGVVGDGSEEVGAGLEEVDIDLAGGRISLLVVIGAGLVLFEGSACSGPAACVVGFRAARLSDRPNMPDVGLLLVPEATADGMPLALPAVAARVRVAIEVPPGGFGSLLGDVLPAAAAGTPLLVAATLLVVVAVLTLFVVSSFFRPLPRPAVGCLSDRERLRADAEEEDDIVSFTKSSARRVCPCTTLVRSLDHARPVCFDLIRSSRTDVAGS